MNYFTFKKSITVSLIALFGIYSIANAQSGSASSSSTKVFGGAKQYRSWSVGANAGVSAPVVFIGGANDFDSWESNLGYGISLRKQFSHMFGIEGNIFRGRLSASNKNVTDGVPTPRSFETDIQYSADLRGVFNLASMNFLHRENAVNFFVTIGYGLIAFNPKVVQDDGKILNYKSVKEARGEKSYIKQGYVPVGAGAKFRISDRLSFKLAYTMNFIDGDNLDGVKDKISKDKFSYASAGIEFSIGSISKPNLDWVNPIAIVYDELKDPTLRQEIEALKKRVGNVEKSIEDLKKDSDGDGVADLFDKCPDTPAGTAVDGSGCPLPPPSSVAGGSGSDGSGGGLGGGSANVTGFETIQFDFNSSVLKTESYPTLDKLSQILREKGRKMIIIGYASSEGTAAYNMKLSKDRANSVKTYLVNSGVSASQIKAIGKGEANPIASNDTEEGRMKNRRVETNRN